MRRGLLHCPAPRRASAAPVLHSRFVCARRTPVRETARVRTRPIHKPKGTMEPELVLVAGLIGDLIAVIEEFVLDLATNTYDAVGWFGVVGMMAIESAAIPLPSEVVMPLAGWKLVLEPGHGPWYLVLAGFYGALGNLIGSLIAYWIGAAGGRPLLERYGRYVLITRNDLARADRWFATRGVLLIAGYLFLGWCGM